MKISSLNIILLKKRCCEQYINSIRIFGCHIYLVDISHFVTFKLQRVWKRLLNNTKSTGAENNSSTSEDSKTLSSVIGQHTIENSNIYVKTVLNLTMSEMSNAKSMQANTTTH